MVRTDDDSWDITESVGATALGVAWRGPLNPIAIARCSPTGMRNLSSTPPSSAAGIPR